MIGHLRVKSPLVTIRHFSWFIGGSLLLTSIISAVILLASGVPMGSQLHWTRPDLVNKLKILQAVSSLTIFSFARGSFCADNFYGRHFYFLGLKRVTKKEFYIIAVIWYTGSLSFCNVAWRRSITIYPCLNGCLILKRIPLNRFRLF